MVAAGHLAAFDLSQGHFTADLSGVTVLKRDQELKINVLVYLLVYNCCMRRFYKRKIASRGETSGTRGGKSRVATSILYFIFISLIKFRCHG